MEVKRGGRFVKGKTATREGGRSGWLNATESPRSRFSLLEGFVHEMSARIQLLVLTLLGHIFRTKLLSRI